MRRLGYTLLGISFILLIYGAFFADPYYPVGRRFSTVAGLASIAACALFYRAAWRDHREALRQSGHCPSCGYDLRASPGRCPECGAAAVNSARTPGSY